MKLRILLYSPRFKALVRSLVMTSNSKTNASISRCPPVVLQLNLCLSMHTYVFPFSVLK